jgi:hypothetical protein
VRGGTAAGAQGDTLVSTHETYWAALQAGEDVEKTFYQRRCSVCKGKGRWGWQWGLTFIDCSCESCEGMGYQLCRRPVQPREEPNP